MMKCLFESTNGSESAEMNRAYESYLEKPLNYESARFESMLNT